MQFTVTREDAQGNETEVELEISYTYHRARSGARDSLGGRRGAGPPLEPDEPASIEILSAKDENGDEVVLTRDEEAAVEEKAFDEVADAANDYPEPDDR